MNNTRSSLWDFSLALYAAPAVESLCVHLQDEWRVNVNLLLWCCWLEQQGTALPADGIVLAQQRLQDWDQQVVWPLRQARRDSKRYCGLHDTMVDVSRAAIKSAELAAERVEILWLEQLAEAWPTRSTPRAVYVVRYLEHLHVPQTVIDGAVAVLCEE